MRITSLLLAAIFALGVVVFCSSLSFAATDGVYTLAETTADWDGTDANRLKTPTADYDHTYGDEASLAFTLPWNFIFYGQSYSRINVDTNGNIWFTATDSASSFSLASAGRGPVIAAWNDDLSSNYYGGAFVQHKTNPERVVIQWKTESYTVEGEHRVNDLEEVLFQSGSIRFDYKTFDTTNGNDSGSGISKDDGTHFLNLTTDPQCGNAYTLAGRSFLFTTTLPSFTITSAADSNGSVSPAGAITVTAGSNQTYTITPNAGFKVSTLVVDGTMLPGATSYTFSNIMSDHYINAYFAPITFTVSGAAGPNGAISPVGATSVTGGSNQTYTITPNAGYMVSILVVDGALLPGATSYTFTNVSADHYINAYFAPITFTINGAAGPNGAISPAGATTVPGGSNQIYTITPNAGFAVAVLVVDGTQLPEATSYTFTNVTADHYINAYFAPITFTITGAAGPNGIISPTGATTVPGGDNQTYTITPNGGFTVAALVVDGTLLPGAASYTITNVSADHYINAYFGP